MADALALHVALCKAVQFFIDDGGQLLKGVLIAFRPGAEQCTNVAIITKLLIRFWHYLWGELYRSEVRGMGEINLNQEPPLLLRQLHGSGYQAAHQSA